MRIGFADGRPDDQVTDLAEARQILGRLWPDAVIGDLEHGRRLVWRNEREAENDAGARAVAEIVGGEE